MDAQSKLILKQSIHDLNNTLTEFSFAIQLLQVNKDIDNKETYQELTLSMQKMQRTISKLQELNEQK